MTRTLKTIILVKGKYCSDFVIIFLLQYYFKLVIPDTVPDVDPVWFQLASIRRVEAGIRDMLRIGDILNGLNVI